MAKKRRRDKRLNVARKMPPLKKREKDAEYDPDEDEVLRWVMAQSELMQYLVNRLKDIGYITYDAETGSWKGADYES